MDVTKKIFSYSFLALFLSACGGSGGSDESADVTEDKSYIGMDYLKGARVVDNVEHSVTRWSGFRSSEGIYYRYSGCSVSGFYQQYGVIYDNGFMYTSFTINDTVYDSVCNVKSVQREVNVTDAQDLNIPYMGDDFFYDPVSGFVYEVGGLNLNPSGQYYIGEIFNNGDNATIVYPGGQLSAEILRVLQDIPTSDVGVKLYSPEVDFFKGQDDQVMEFGYATAAYERPYSFNAGNLFLYEASGCEFSSLRGYFYIVYNDSVVYTRDDRTGVESYCVVDSFYEEVSLENDQSVYAVYSRRGLFYDASTGVYYEVEGANTFAGYFISEIKNDGKSAVVYSSQSSEVPMTLLTVKAYKEYYPEF